MTDYYSPPSRDSLYFSGHVPTSIMGGLALPGLLFLSFLLYINVPILYYFFPVAYILLSPFAWYYFAFVKTRQHLENTEFLVIFQRAKMRIGLSGAIQLFLSTEKKKTLLNNARTPFLRGLLVSEKAAKSIVQHPSEGEIVLAHELALLKRDHLWLSFLRNIGASIYAMFSEAVLFLGFIASLLPSFYQIPLWLLALFITYPCGIGLYILYHRKSAAKYEIETIYGMNPQLAMFQVFCRQNMSDAGRRFYIDEIESNIALRRSRTIPVSLGVSIIASIVISAIVYTIFFLNDAPIVFTEFAALLLGGISFSLGVYHYESKGTRGLKTPQFESESLPRADDELSIEVERLLCTKLKTADCALLRYPSEIFEDDDGIDILQCEIAGIKLNLFQDEIDTLGDPELIASYISGSYVERISEIRSRIYGLILLWFPIQSLGGIIWLIIILQASIVMLITWIIFSCVQAAVLLIGIKAISFRKSIKALTILSKNDNNYIIALKKLVESETTDIYSRGVARRILRRITSQSNPPSMDYSESH